MPGCGPPCGRGEGPRTFPRRSRGATMAAPPKESDMRAYHHASASFAWRASTFKSPSDYILELTRAERDEITAAVAAIDRGGRLAPSHALTKEDFRFGGLGARLERAYAEVRSGRGFVLLRGLPVEELTLEHFTAGVWGVGLQFGRALSQNAQGELIGAVVDATSEEATPRMYRSNLELRPHSDITAMILLACWNKSASGGASIIVSGVTVHDEIRARAPRLLEPLYRGYHYHRLGEERPGEEPATADRVPVFAGRGGQRSCRYRRSVVRRGRRTRARDRASRVPRRAPLRRGDGSGSRGRAARAAAGRARGSRRAPSRRSR